MVTNLKSKSTTGDGLAAGFNGLSIGDRVTATKGAGSQVNDVKKRYVDHTKLCAHLD